MVNGTFPHYVILCRFICPIHLVNDRHLVRLSAMKQSREGLDSLTLDRAREIH